MLLCKFFEIVSRFHNVRGEILVFDYIVVVVNPQYYLNKWRLDYTYNPNICSKIYYLNQFYNLILVLKVIKVCKCAIPT